MKTIFKFRWVRGYGSFYRWSYLSKLSPEAKRRLHWFDYYYKHKNVAQTCRYFGIARKTFYYWHTRYDSRNLSTLETGNYAPKRKRQRQITPEQEANIVALRKKYIRYGKLKLVRYYEEEYGHQISSWKIQKVIEKKGLYYHPLKTARIAKKRKQATKKNKITQLKKKKVAGFLWCVDTIVIYWHGVKRYIFTAIDHHSKIAFARMYTSKSSKNASDFLKRLYYLIDSQIANMGHDNGTEWQGAFAQACQELKIPQWYSRPKTPKDNAVNERFNRTLQEEFIQLGNFTDNVILFNQRLTEWLVEYNFRRPHQTLNYLPPINYEARYLRVLPRYPSYTIN